jgi:DNA-binding PadR family transcriptional regulator
VPRVRRPSPQTVAVLDALAANTSDWSHGYDLCRALDLKAGTVYPILIRLAERGYVDATWEQDVPPGRPPRHLYRLSAAGAEHVRELRDAADHRRSTHRSRRARHAVPGDGTVAGARP